MRTLVIGSLALVALALVLGPIVACYDANTPLPPCSAAPTACGDYPDRRPLDDAGR